METHRKISDSKFEELFSTWKLERSMFNHEAHIRIAYLYILKYGIRDAIKKLSSELKNYIESESRNGQYYEKKNKKFYNATLTIASMKIVEQRIMKTNSQNFNTFIEKNKDLQEDFIQIIWSHYRDNNLHSEIARYVYIEPDIPFEEEIRSSPNFDFLSDYWHMYTYPWRPWKTFLKYLQKIIWKESKVCILGSTQELRLFCKEIWCSVDIYDISESMVLKGDVENEKEKIFIQDWFDIYWNTYDYILGDLILFLIPQEKQDAFLKLLLNNTRKWWSIILRSGRQKKWNIKEFWDFVSKISVSNVGILNYIIFELVVWLKYRTNDISWFLFEYNKVLCWLFQDIFMDIVPYGDSNIASNCLENKAKIEYWKSFFLSEEVFLEFHH